MVHVHIRFHLERDLVSRGISLRGTLRYPQPFFKRLTLIRPVREPNYECSPMAANCWERSHSPSESVSTLLREPRSQAGRIFLSFETSRFR